MIQLYQRYEKAGYSNNTSFRNVADLHVDQENGGLRDQQPKHHHLIQILQGND